MNSLIGQTLSNRFRVDAFLGKGGMAEVYKAWDSQRAVYLAIKLLQADLAEDAVFLRRFEREASTLTSLQHPNIVRSYGLERDQHLAFLVMDYIEGTTLRREIFERGQPFTPFRITEILRPVCAALHFAHTQGFVHCDIKPANIMIHINGTVLISDFGIARLMESATATMTGLGTPAYMAPEQVRHEIPGPYSDLYALGIVLYEMLTGGERPFTGEQALSTGTTAERVLWEQINLAPISPRRFNRAITPELEGVTLKCLEKDPARRFSSALELLNNLESALSQMPGGIKTLTPAPVEISVQTVPISEPAPATILAQTVLESEAIQGQAPPPPGGLPDPHPQPAQGAPSRRTGRLLSRLALAGLAGLCLLGVVIGGVLVWNLGDRFSTTKQPQAPANLETSLANTVQAVAAATLAAPTSNSNGQRQEPTQIQVEIPVTEPAPNQESKTPTFEPTSTEAFTSTEVPTNPVTIAPSETPPSTVTILPAADSTLSPNGIPILCGIPAITGNWTGRAGSRDLTMNLVQEDCQVTGSDATNSLDLAGIRGSIKDGKFYFEELGNESGYCYWRGILEVSEEKMVGKITTCGGGAISLRRGPTPTPTR